MHHEWSRPNAPGIKKIGADAPVILAVGLHRDVRPPLELAAAAHGLRVVFARHLNAACTALEAQPVAVVLADESTRPWDQEVLREKAAAAQVGIVWVEAELAHDFMVDVIRMYVHSRGPAPQWRGAAYAS